MPGETGLGLLLQSCGVGAKREHRRCSAAFRPLWGSFQFIDLSLTPLSRDVMGEGTVDTLLKFLGS